MQKLTAEEGHLLRELATQVQGEVLQGLFAKEVSLFSWKTAQGEGVAS